MSSFDLKDEIIYKSKYIKYKNKYINLKIEQEGSGTYGNKTSIIFYENSSFTAMQALKDEYFKALSKNADEKIGTTSKKKMSVDTFLNSKFTIKFDDINGLPNIYEFKIKKQQTSNRDITGLIEPIMIFKPDNYRKLIECFKKTGGFKNMIDIKREDLQLESKIKELKNDISLFKKSHVKVTNDEMNEILPIVSSSISAKAAMLIKMINNPSGENATILETRQSKLEKIFDEFARSIESIVGDKIRPKTFIRELNKVDSYIVVKNFTVDADGNVSFMIEDIGNPSSTVQPAESQALENQ